MDEIEIKARIRQINKSQKLIMKQFIPNRDEYNRLDYEKKDMKQQLKDMKPKKAKKPNKKRIDPNKEYKKWRAKADTIFSKYIRKRDSWGKDHLNCITCWKRIRWEWNGNCHNCHRIPRGYYSHRWDEDNCYAGCSWCNTYLQEEHHNKLTMIQIKERWLERAEVQQRHKNRKKPTVDKLKKIVEKYEKKYEDLHNEK